MLQGELWQLKELIFGKRASEVCKNLSFTETEQLGANFNVDTMEPVHQNVNILELKNTVKETRKKVQELEEITISVQDFMEDFVKLYECRNGVVDFVITKHENDLKTSRDAICIVGEKVQSNSEHLSSIERRFIQRMNVLPMKLEGCVEEVKKSNEMFISIDEHNQLRRNLEDQVMACDIKCEHILLMVQQYGEECKRQCDEVKVIKGVVTRAKKRRESALSNIESRYRILTETIENESKTNKTHENMNHADPIMKNCSLHHDDSRKVHFDAESENTSCTLRYEFEDNESEFGTSVSLVLLDEHSIY
jgi:hypothetical protein